MNLNDLSLEYSIDLKELNDKLFAFEHAIKTYINKPQVVNKWLAGSVSVKSINLDEFNLSNKSLNEFETRQFLSKNTKIFTNITYLIISDFKLTNSVLFHPLNITNKINDNLKYSSVNFTHSFQYDKQENKLKLYIISNLERNEKINLQIKWLTDTLMSKLINWSLSIDENDFNFNCAKLNTLTLYDNMLNEYSSLYQHLKDIYWLRFNTGWLELTNTNPEKFIHEDISIACYFILAWKYLKINIKKFVDLGCGNGLLVYILNDQGYNGYGIDMRKRKIWSNDYYIKSNIKLIEKTIDPKNDLFEDCDCLIGNHSDELSPWLPYISYRSSHISKLPCHIMLIPCCFFDFNSKYDVKKKNESRYDTYLNYLTTIFEYFKFKLYKDKLRIPSTRNVCLIGLSDLNKNEKLINEIDLLHFNTFKLNQTQFIARDLNAEKEKSSRNCTKNVDNNLKLYIMKKVLDNLLTESNLIDKYDGSKWNAGKTMCLNEIACLFNKTELNKLKLECGGIKTLLKNYHQLFFIEHGDKLRLRNTILDTDTKTNTNKIKKNEKKNTFFKTKQCLFYLYHPNGCLLNNDQCNFKHE